MAFCTYFSKSPKPKLFISKDLVDDLWSILKIGLDSIEGEKVSLDTYFEVHPVDKKFEWEGIDFRLVKAEHVWANDVLMPVYGLVFGDIYFSSDTMMCDTVKAEYKKAKLIFHDCETNPWKSKVHAHYDDLKLLPETIKNKMWLYHYSPNPVQKPKEDGFCGFVEKGQKFDG